MTTAAPEGSAPHNVPIDGVARRSRSRLPTWAKVLLWIAGVGMALLVAFVLFFAAMLSGGFDNLFDFAHPSADDADVEAARDEAVPVADDLLRAALDGPVGAVLPATPFASALGTRCIEGQHNWKIDNTFDLSCRLTRVEVVNGGTLATFRDDMVALDEALLAAGWESDADRPMQYLLSGYWDDRQQIISANPDFEYPADMPAAAYELDGLEMSLSWTQRDADRYSTQADEQSTWHTADGSPTTGADVTRLVPEGGYALVLTVSLTYFEE